MSLTDLMSAMGLAVFPLIAMVIFIAVFIGVVIYTFHPRNRQRHRSSSQMPLDDHNPVIPREREQGDDRE